MTAQILRFYPRIVKETDLPCRVLGVNNLEELVDLRSYDVILISTSIGSNAARTTADGSTFQDAIFSSGEKGQSTDT
jgi:hypothetical protein